MGLEPMDELERELRQALKPMPAPPGLKRKVMQRRSAPRHRPRIVLWRRLAAAATLAVVLAAALIWHNVEQRRKGEEARRQVMIALRVTSHALNQVEAQLAANSRAPQE